MQSLNHSLSQARVKELLKYDPTTGDLVWLVSRGKAKVGKVAGCIYSDGYRVVEIFGERYRSTHLAFLLMTGKMPREMVDHVDGTKSNDRWGNLREATRSQNGANQKLQSRKNLPLKGVERTPGGNYRASLRHHRKLIHLGTFGCPAAAHFAYAVAADIHHGEFARFS